MKKEIWKDVKGYEGSYQVSNFGRVKGLDRSVPHGRGNKTRRIKGRILNGSLDYGGYRLVDLRNDNSRRVLRVHQLVAVAFLGHIPCGHKLVVDHIDGNCDNNHVDNLRIVTPRENSSTCYRKNQSNYSSEYIGVSWIDEKEKWSARIHIEGRDIHLGFFDVELDASNAYQEALRNIGNKEYFESLKPKYSSIHKHIFFNKARNKWQANWYANRKRIYIGVYETEQQAYEAQQFYLKENNLI